MAVLTWIANNIIPILVVSACLGTIIGFSVKKAIIYKEKKNLSYQKQKELNCSPRKFIPASDDHLEVKPMTKETPKEKDDLEKIMDIINKV